MTAENLVSVRIAEQFFGFELAQRNFEKREHLIQDLNYAQALGLDRIRVLESYFHAKYIAVNGHGNCHPWYDKLRIENESSANR